ncbi:tyrosine-protein phosphatase non-receptor type 3 isoform X2 [Scleropages formosus]|uniref:tyrosine-protein phosphatase non-receptor type 3 isoform X2 n=1 Tax=Scleropages formosus TaxID=113540 RepID=UPI00087871C2|nr:tyrosine-protein phosphatase non-receptor type 3 isoform X2 [Scleropages formosus]
MNSRLPVFGGRISNAGSPELSKEKTKADAVCDVRFLDGTARSFKISQDDGHSLLDAAFNHVGLPERELFGLQLAEEPADSAVSLSPARPLGVSARWLDPHKAVKKQFKGSAPWLLNFRVRFFIADPNSLQQEKTRHLYFLQIRSDIQSGRLSCPLSSAVVLASYAVQSELGDHCPSEHPPGYLSASRFLPAQDEDFLFKVESLHPQHRGLKQSEAELCYLNIARTLDFYGVELHSARDSSNADLLIGIASSGLAVFRNMLCSSFFSWVSIIKISFKRKKFFIHLKEKHRECRDCTISFTMLNYRACKNLWRSCVEHHTFFQADTSLPRDKKVLLQHWTLKSKTPAKTLNSQIMRRVMGGMAWKTVLRRSLSGEHLETKSLPSRSPPTTPSWRSPRLRHNIRKPRPSSMDNLASEMSYITESEDVFYTYRRSIAGSGSDSDAAGDLTATQMNCPEGHHEKDVSPDIQHTINLSEPSSWDPTKPIQPVQVSHIPSELDYQLPENEPSPKEKKSDRDSYYFDRNEEVEGDLLLVRIAPDKDGKFGFNVKGGVDQKMPLVISHVSPDSPAGKCNPQLKEGDHIVLINGRDISEHTHDQVVMFIKASRESHTKELALLIRRKGVCLRVEPQDKCNSGFTLPGDTLLLESEQYGGSLETSMAHLKRGLQTGTLLIQFEQLYRKKPGMSMHTARLSQNMEKNRYKDVLPYDATRVVLENNDDDYLNASHVKMEVPAAEVANHYLASQGPLPHTCSHFWQAVWEQQVHIIIMLTTLTERGRPKCHQYWPDPPELLKYGTLQVRCHSEECNLAYVSRELVLTNTETGEERAVSHLQYVAWPDHGVPDDPSDFLDFVTCVQQKLVDAKPLMVHCSAGIGRTGVFITMETAMKLIEKGQPVYPLDLVRRLRDQRAMMVQTSSQYRFVCEAILRVYEERHAGSPASPPHT